MTTSAHWRNGTLAYSAYVLPLVRPVRIGATTFSARSGLVVRVEVGGAVTYGDCAPLPGLSTEHLDEVMDALRAGSSAVAQAVRRLPSLGLALDGTSMRTRAELDIARAHDVRTAVLLGDGAAPADVVAQLLAACHAGHVQTAKLKVGRGLLVDDLGRVRALAALCRTRGVRLRLDGNRALNVHAAHALAEACADVLDYFEEPVPPASIGMLHDVPLAFDETFDRGDDGDLAAVVVGGRLPADAPLLRAAAWVLKPTNLGPARFRERAGEAQRAGIRVVVSSCYESHVGRTQLQALADDIDHTQGAQVHGLGTATAFAHDIDPRTLEERAWTVVQ